MVATVSVTDGAVACFFISGGGGDSHSKCSPATIGRSSFSVALLPRPGVRYEARRLGRWHRTFECHYLTQSRINSLSIRYRSVSKMFAGEPQREPLRLLCKCDDLAAHPAFRLEFHLGRTVQGNMRTAGGQRHCSQKKRGFLLSIFSHLKKSPFSWKNFYFFCGKSLDITNKGPIIS